jgi:hypothetical protein
MSARVAVTPLIPGHLPVHEHQVGTQGTDCHECLIAVGAFADHQETICIAQRNSQSGAEEIMVVNDQHPDHRCHRPWQGVRSR